jgi:exosortase
MQAIQLSKWPLHRQNLALIGICLFTMLVFWPSVRVLVSLSLNDQRYWHLVFAPLFCILLIQWRRSRILANACFAPRLGAPMLGASALIGVILQLRPHSNTPEGLLLITLMLMLCWMAAFLLCYGAQSFRLAIYPLACLFLAVPVPGSWMDWAIFQLQQGSAAMTYSLFEGLGVTVFRNGMDFSIPGLTFNIAPECSGIHSGQIFVIIGILCAYVFLRSGWTRALLILLTIPIAIFKNAARIVVITLLGSYVNQAFILGPFHHKYGGIIFAPLDLVLFVPLLFLLYKIEPRSTPAPG